VFWWSRKQQLLWLRARQRTSRRYEVARTFVGAGRCAGPDLLAPSPGGPSHIDRLEDPDCDQVAIIPEPHADEGEPDACDRESSPLLPPKGGGFADPKPFPLQTKCFLGATTAAMMRIADPRPAPLRG
jgi:hypothetical protein